MRPYDTNEPENEQLTTSRRSHRKPGSDQLLGFRNVLNIIFMLLAIVGVVVYVWFDSTIGTYVVLASMGVKMVECCIRMLK